MKSDELNSPIKFIMKAPKRIGNCTHIDQRVKKPMIIITPPAIVPLQHNELVAFHYQNFLQYLEFHEGIFYQL